MAAVWFALGSKIWTKWLYVTSTFDSWCTHPPALCSLSLSNRGRCFFHYPGSLSQCPYWSLIKHKKPSLVVLSPWANAATSSYNQSGLMVQRSHTLESRIWPRCGMILCSSPTLWKWIPKVWIYCGLCYQVSVEGILSSKLLLVPIDPCCLTEHSILYLCCERQ